ncbi:PHP-associated domain-containing protein [Chloroflexota bacterium]
MIYNENSLEQIYVDFHVHTHYSKDSLLSPEKILQRIGIAADRLAITDHNTIKGAEEVYKLDPENIIVGEEVMTTKGEILAFFVQEEVPAGLDPRKAIQLLHDQNAYISVSHPFDRYRKGSWKEKDLISILPGIDAIEGFNARVMSGAANKLALGFAEKHHLQITAGSDAHAYFEIGKAGIILPRFKDADELRKNIPKGSLVAKRSLWWVHLFSSYARYQKERKQG